MADDGARGRIGDFMATRRDVLTALGSGALALHGSAGRAVAASSGTAQTGIAYGCVYEVHGEGQRRTRCDDGLAGVMLSNGRDVVCTVANGAWALPVRNGDCVFVIKPAQWRVAGKLGAFWRHVPRAGGRHEMNFALERHNEPRRFEVLLVADTQASTIEELAFVRHDLLAATRDSQAAFAIHHGDAMGDDLSLMPDYLEIIEETGLPWHHCPGNHDMDFGAAGTAGTLALWKQLVGPGYYAFEHGEAVFLILNNVEPVEPSAGEKPYRGRFGADQLRFVRNVLRHVDIDRLVVVSMHIPLQCFGEPNAAAATTADRAELLELLSAYPHTLSFAGHSHTSEHHYFGREEGSKRDRPHHHQVLTAVCGSWWSGERDAHGVPVADSRDGSPRGHHVLSIEGPKASTRFVPARPAGPNQMRVMLCREDESGTLALADQRLGVRETCPVALVVDVFDGGARTRVSVTFNGLAGTATAMTAISVIDPYVKSSYARTPALCKPWLEACASSHIWHTALPADLGAGVHTVAVTAASDTGAVHRETFTFEVVA